jgi:hypothetical protein
MTIQVHELRYIYSHYNFLKTILTVLIISSMSAYSQHDITKYKLVNIQDPILPLITNRSIDTLAYDWKVLQNEIDHRNSLKVFIADIEDDSIYCNQVTNLSLSYLLSQPGNDWVLLIHGDSKAPLMQQCGDWKYRICTGSK